MMPIEITNGSIKTQKYWSSTLFQNSIYGKLIFIHATEGLTNWLVFVIFQSIIFFSKVLRKVHLQRWQSIAQNLQQNLDIQFFFFFLCTGSENCKVFPVPRFWAVSILKTEVPVRFILSHRSWEIQELILFNGLLI